MTRWSKTMALTVAVLLLAAGAACAATSHQDLMTGPFESGPDVTKACLGCHEDAAHDVMKTTHWTWSSPQEVPGRGVIDRGKKNTINNFCISVSSNWPRCTSCHSGYGWKDASFDFSDTTRVDCLVCHDTTGTYKKDPTGAGTPVGPRPATALEPARPGVDLLHVARNVGVPGRGNCGACHFFGGGGDRVKHGDLDSSLLSAGRDLDVHMAVEGADMACQDCHRTENHNIKGNAMVVSPGDHNHLDCADCHQEPHGEPILNGHASRVACQTCHIPSFARALPTKVSWDWSTAGQDIEVLKDEHGMPTYAKKKGSFVWDKDIIPTYAWYDGKAGVYLLGERMDPDAVTRLNWPEGSVDDPRAKIFPFKSHRGNQIYDTGFNYLVSPKLFGKGGYWKTYDWDAAARLGMKEAGLEYSGEYGFARTVMYWRINHMVAPAKDALGCLDCHGEQGRLDWAALGYDADPLRYGSRGEEVASVR